MQFSAPDGAILSPRPEIAPFLTRPEYYNFMPKRGMFLIADARLVVVSPDGARIGPSSLQLQADQKLLQSVSAPNMDALAAVIAELWCLPPQTPGAGIAFLTDRGLVRRLVFGNPLPDAVKRLFLNLKTRIRD